MENNYPLVTVRMPAYNHEQYVEQAIMSVVNQTYKNIQFIVVDDGSKDNTPNIIERLATKYNFTFIRQENKGVCETLNIIYKITKGEYILGCASDDYLAEDAVENLVNETLISNVDIIYGRVKIVKNHHIIGEIPFTNLENNSVVNKKDILLKKCRTPIGGFMYKKKILDEIYPLPHDIKQEDAFFMMKLSQNARFSSCNVVTKYYRIHDTNTIQDDYKMYLTKKYMIASYYVKNEDIDGLYLASTKAGWFKSLSYNHKKSALKYLIDAIFFVFKTKFSDYSINLLGSGILRLLNMKSPKLKL